MGKYWKMPPGAKNSRSADSWTGGFGGPSIGGKDSYGNGISNLPRSGMDKSWLLALTISFSSVKPSEDRLFLSISK